MSTVRFGTHFPASNNQSLVKLAVQHVLKKILAAALAPQGLNSSAGCASVFTETYREACHIQGITNFPNQQTFKYGLRLCN